MTPLFEHYPGLAEKISHTSFANLPTPVEPLSRIAERFNIGGLYIKRDDKSGAPYGGNKVRKLEFLLGEALREKAAAVLTFGAAGSNHALATAVYARQTGLGSISMLTPQHNARYVGKNLLLGRAFGAEIHYYPDRQSLVAGTRSVISEHTKKDGRPPYIIPFGGTTPLGTAGFVNAAFELRRQIEQGELPEPDILFAALGSMGTAAGLSLGLRAAGLRTSVCAVRVVIDDIANMEKCGILRKKTNELLHSLCPDFPLFSGDDMDFTIVHDFFGGDYALFTEEGQEAVRTAWDLGEIRLEGTYTGKTFAALLARARGGQLKKKNVLFWNTLNSRDLSGFIRDADYRDLPPELHRYFTEKYQSLEIASEQ